MLMKSLIRPILAVFILPISMTSFAQLEELGNVPTPTATQLGKFGDVPVSYYTGRADISIPLYSTTLHGIPLDVSLSYDSGGVPVNQIPGLVGECWTLNAGGVITRSQDGGEDEYTSYPYNTVQYRNYFHNYDFVPRNLDNIHNDSVWYTGCAPNIYHFNFMGMSGRFFLGNDGEWKVASDSNIDVVFDIDDPNNYMTARSWYLTEVLDRNGNNVYRFGYAHGNMLAQL